MLSTLLEVTLNYIFVLSCIVLFFLPFYLLFRYKKPRQYDGKLNPSRELNDFFLSRQSNYLVFFWAMGEAIIWFVIPEFLLLLVIFMKVHRKKELLVYDVAGTVAGTVLAFLIHVPLETIGKLPYVQPKMVEQTIAWYQQSGIWGLFYQPFSGVPYKVFTLTAKDFGFFLITFIIVAVVVRMSRYVIFFGLFVALYPGLHKFVYQNYVKLFLIATLIFTFLLLKVVNKFDADYMVTWNIDNAQSVQHLPHSVSFFNF